MIKANTMQKLLGHSQAYSFTLYVLKTTSRHTHTHTHTQFVLKKCTIKWPYMVLNMTIASQNLEGWTIITHTHTLLAKKPTSHKIDWSGNTHQSMKVLSLLIIKNQAWEFTQPFYFFPYIFICTFIYNTCHYDLTLNNS